MRLCHSAADGTSHLYSFIFQWQSYHYYWFLNVKYNVQYGNTFTKQFTTNIITVIIIIHIIIIIIIPGTASQTIQVLIITIQTFK